MKWILKGHGCLNPTEITMKITRFCAQPSHHRAAPPGAAAQRCLGAGPAAAAARRPGVRPRGSRCLRGRRPKGCSWNGVPGWIPGWWPLFLGHVWEKKVITWWFLRKIQKMFYWFDQVLKMMILLLIWEKHLVIFGTKKWWGILRSSDGIFVTWSCDCTPKHGDFAQQKMEQ